MQAPSEKHLEDYLWDHPEALGMVGVPPEYGPDFPMYDFWARQFSVPSGRVDMIGKDYRVCAFELKKGTITAQSLTQLMRYMFDVRNLVERLLMEYLSYGEPLRTWAQDYWSSDFQFNSDCIVRGVLVGHDYEDENLLVACAGCGVDLFTYEYTDGFYTFEDRSVDCMSMSIEYYQSMIGIIGSDFAVKFFDSYKDDIKKKYDNSVKAHNNDFDALRAAEDHLKNNGKGES